MFIIPYFGVNLLMFGVMFEIMLRMVYQTGIVKAAAPYNIKVISGKNFKYLFKNKRQTYLTVLVGTFMCSLVILFFEIFSEGEYSGKNLCEVDRKKI